MGTPINQPQIKNGWNEWSRHVLSELERLNTCYNNLDEKLDGVKIDVATLKVKASMWGGIGATRCWPRQHSCCCLPH